MQIKLLKYFVILQRDEKKPLFYVLFRQNVIPDNSGCPDGNKDLFFSRALVLCEAGKREIPSVHGAMHGRDSYLIYMSFYCFPAFQKSSSFLRFAFSASYSAFAFWYSAFLR